MRPPTPTAHATRLRPMPHSLPPPETSSASSASQPRPAQGFALTRFVTRLVTGLMSLAIAAVLGLMLLMAAIGLAVGLGLRRLIARIQGKPVQPWGLPAWWHVAASRQTLWPQAPRTHTVRTDEGQEVEIVVPPQADHPSRRPASGSSRPFAQPFASPFNQREPADVTDVRPHDESDKHDSAKP